MRRIAPAARVAAGFAILAYLGAWAVSGLVTDRMPSDLDLYFWPSAQVAAHGHPLLIYSVLTGDVNPNANGPLSMIVLAPLVALANVLGTAADIRFRAGVAGVIGGVFALLLTYEALRIVRVARGGLDWQVAASIVFLLSPALLIAVGDYGHLEQPLELWLVLLAVRSAAARRGVLTGALLGLAVLTRTVALLYAIPLLIAAVARRRIERSLRIAAGAAAVVGAGLAPFFIADGADAAHSLITYRGARTIEGGTLWAALANTPVATIVQHGDVFIVAAAALVACGLLAWRRPAAVATSRGTCALLTITAACFPMLVKTSYPYYVVEPYVFAAVWWLARPGWLLTWRVLAPALLIGLVFMAKASSPASLAGIGPLEGVAASLVLAAVIAVVAADLIVQPAGDEHPRSPRGVR